MNKPFWLSLLVVTAFIAGAVAGMLVVIYTGKGKKTNSTSQKNLSTCRQVLASKDSQVATDLMNLIKSTEEIKKRIVTMASLVSVDAELKAEIRWLVHTSMRIERQGMVGCTYKRNKRGKLRKCTPKFNISDCKKDKGYWTCPIPEPSVVKQKRRRKR